MWTGSAKTNTRPSEPSERQKSTSVRPRHPSGGFVSLNLTGCHMRRKEKVLSRPLAARYGEDSEGKTGPGMKRMVVYWRRAGTAMKLETPSSNEECGML